MALNAITMSATHAAISQKGILANSLAIAITKATRIHRPKAGSRAAILRRNAATWTLATKLASEFDRNNRRSLQRSELGEKPTRWVRLTVIPIGPNFESDHIPELASQGRVEEATWMEALMRNTLIGLLSLLGLTLFPGIAAAQSNTAIGVGTGAVTGAVVGGPVGAVVGGVVGGSVGAATEPHRYRVYRPHRRVAYHRHYRHHPRRYSRY